MKNILLIACLLNCFTVFGQTYIPMPIENGMNWRIETHTATMDYEDDETIVGDTIIGGLIYNKVRRYTTIFNSGYVSYEFIRNDSINKRIYFRHNNHDTLLYDFNLGIGDTIHSFHLKHLRSSGIDTVRVAAIDSISLNGVYHRRYISVRIASSPDYFYNVIEGVGSENGFIKNYTVFEHGTYLKCQGKFGALSIYPDSSYFCDAPLKSYDFESNPFINIYPNPASSYIRVHSNVQSSSMLIYDMFDRIIYQKTKHVDSDPIEIKSWSKGVYFLQLKFANGQTHGSKFVKE